MNLIKIHVFLRKIESYFVVKWFHFFPIGHIRCEMDNQQIEHRIQERSRQSNYHIERSLEIMNDLGVLYMIYREVCGNNVIQDNTVSSTTGEIADTDNVNVPSRRRRSPRDIFDELYSDSDSDFGLS